MYRIRQSLRPEQVRELSLVFIIILAVLFFGTQIRGYYSARTFERIADGVAILTVLAVGQTLVVLTRNIDLSVGSIVGFTAYYTGQQLSLHPGMSPLVAVGIAVGFGMILGVINGVIVSYGRVPSIIVTLGTLAIFRGTFVNYTQSKTISTAMLPQWLLDLPRQNLLAIGEIDIRVMVGLAIIVVIVFQIALGNLRFGRRLYAIGSNPDASAIAGLPSRRIILVAFILCGGLAGLAGFMFLVRFGTITVSAGLGLELSSVAAVVVGGVDIFGGSGTALGALLGAVTIGTLQQSLLRMPNVSQFVQDALLGLFILLAVASDTVILERLRALRKPLMQPESTSNAPDETNKESGNAAPR